MSENNYKTISFIVPTIERDSLQDTLNSIKTWPGDEILVIKHNPPSGNWGNAERQEGMDKAKGDYLAFIDDDDRYVPGHREIMDKAIKENVNNYPMLFRMQYPSGRVLWQKKWVKNGNVGCPMILVPNIKEMLSPWDQKHSWADFAFINRWHWPAKKIQWRTEIIALLGHDDEKHEKQLSIKELKKVQRERWKI